MSTTKICEQCGDTFMPRPYKIATQRFCSKHCWKTNRDSAHAEKICENCGKQFTVTRRREMGKKFCGTVCVREYEAIHGRPAAQTTPIEFSCRQCGKSFSYKQAYLTEYNKKYGKNPMYCSIQCSAFGRKTDAEARRTCMCLQCGKPMSVRRKTDGQIYRHQRLCSTECRSLYRRLSYQKKHPNQEPTKRAQPNGYIRIIIPGKSGGPSRETFEHRYVMEQHLGRRLYTEETVHHKNGDRSNNSLKNLELFSSRHGPGQRVTDKIAFAIEMLRLYPDFAKAQGVMLVDCDH